MHSTIKANVTIDPSELLSAIEDDVTALIDSAIEYNPQDFQDQGDVEQIISDADFCFNDKVSDMIDSALNDFQPRCEIEDNFHSMFQDNAQALIRDIEDEASLATADYDQLFANYNVLCDKVVDLENRSLKGRLINAQFVLVEAIGSLKAKFLRKKNND